MEKYEECYVNHVTACHEKNQGNDGEAAQH